MEKGSYPGSPLNDPLLRNDDDGDSDFDGYGVGGGGGGGDDVDDDLLGPGRKRGGDHQ